LEWSGCGRKKTRLRHFQQTEFASHHVVALQNDAEGNILSRGFLAAATEGGGVGE